MKKILFFALFAIPFTLSAQEDTVDENKLFENPDAMIIEKKDSVDEDQKKKHLGFSGELNSINRYYMTRDFFTNGEGGGNRFYPYMQASVIMDARLPDDTKGIANMEALYNARTGKSEYDMKELFIQFNLAKKLYITAGKQVLTWGRCYLWNPTDLVNVEKKSFTKKIGSQEGTYGLKGHIPFGTRANIYAFANTLKTQNVNDIAGALKFEILAGTTESAFSIWGKKKYHPVGAFDFSTRILGLDILGEASISKGSNQYQVKEVTGVPLDTLTIYRDNNTVIPKASIDVGRSFDVGDQSDKISVKGEFFFNGDGNKKNVFADSSIYTFDKPVTIEDYDGNKQQLAMGTKTIYLTGNNIYTPNYYSRYYAALFTSINKFIISELTLSMNFISNISQRSYMLSTGIDYLNINNFKSSIYVNGYFGKKNTEYTAAGYGADIMASAGIIF